MTEAQALSMMTRTVLKVTVYLFSSPEALSEAADVIRYGLLATLSPATRDALKVIFPAPRSAARKPLSVVVRAGSAVPYVLLFATALTEAAALSMLKLAVL